MCLLGHLRRCVVSWLSGLCWGSPAARRADDQTLLCQEGHKVRRAGRLREFKWRDGLRKQGEVWEVSLNYLVGFSPFSLSHTHRTNPGRWAQDGGEGAALHQLTKSGGRVQGPHQAWCRGNDRVRVLLPDLLPAATTDALQQTGGTVEPCAQPCRLRVLLRHRPVFSDLRSCRESVRQEKVRAFLL